MQFRYTRWNAGYRVKYRPSQNLLDQLERHLLTHPTGFLGQRSFLPNLTTLSWEFEEYTDIRTNLIPLIADSSLKALTIVGSYEPPSTEAVQSMAGALHFLSSRCPHIQKIEIYRFSDDGWDMGNLFSVFIKSLREVREIGTHDFRVSIEDVAHLSNLTNYSGYFSPRRNQTSGKPRALILPGLRDWKLEVPDLEDVNILLSRVSSTSLRRLDIGVPVGPSITPGNIQGIFMSVKTQTLMEELALTIRHDINVRPVLPGALPDIVIDSKVFEPLLSLRNLCKVFLEKLWVVDLDDSLIRDMAMAWGQIQWLSISPKLGLPYPPRITVKGLLDFARYCPRLLFLAIPLNPLSPSPEDSYAASQISETGHRLEMFDILAWSRLYDPEALATFLVTLFPLISAHAAVRFLGTLPTEVTESWSSLCPFMRGYGAALELQREDEAYGSDSDIDEDVEMDGSKDSGGGESTDFRLP